MCEYAHAVLLSRFISPPGLLNFTLSSSTLLLKFIGFNELGAVAQYDHKQIISRSSKSHHLAVISNPNSLQCFLPQRIKRKHRGTKSVRDILVMEMSSWSSAGEEQRTHTHARTHTHTHTHTTHTHTHTHTLIHLEYTRNSQRDAGQTLWLGRVNFL